MNVELVTEPDRNPYSNCCTLLWDSLPLEFPESEEYIWDSQFAVLVVQAKENPRMQQESRHWREASECLAKAKHVMKSGAQKDDVRTLIRELNRQIDYAIAGGELDVKLRLIRKKEQLLDRLFEASE